jgi:excisionase family DNA binding protein
MAVDTTLERRSCEPRQVFNLEGAADYLGIGHCKMAELLKAGRIRHVHIGRLVRVHKIALDEFMLESHSHDPSKVLAKHGITVPDGLRVVGSRQRR